VVSFHECDLIRAYPERRNHFSVWLRAAAAGGSAASAAKKNEIGSFVSRRRVCHRALPLLCFVRFRV
jgi:hypothetical protein